MLRVLITGGSRGIGAAVAQAYREAGRYDVFTPPRSELDLTDRRSIEAYVQKHGKTGFDIIINNAGDNRINNIDALRDEDIDHLVGLNLIAPMLLLRGFVPAMKAKKFGRIVNVGSIWGVAARPGRVVYAATKHGIHGITQTLAAELAADNILVNTICPGFTLTELTKRTNTPQQLEALAAKVPMGRMAQPGEIAQMIFTVGNENNTYMTGQQITVDGGYTSV